MGYISKSIKNSELAKICYEDKNFDACVNREYYSFFQMILHKLEANGIVLNNEEKYGSHINTFNRYIKLAQSKNIINTRTGIKLRTSFEDFKKIRTNADYKPEFLDEKQAKRAQSLSKNLSSKLRLKN